MIFDGPIETFSPFHNINCDHGFIYFTRNGSLKIANLDRRMNYHNQWPLYKAPINVTDQPFPCRTAEKMEYHQKSQKYCVVTFEEVPFTIAKADEYQELQEDEELPETEEPEVPLVPDPGIVI
jgi:cleavage and polyadenylation specificity factor subunit 1